MSEVGETFFTVVGCMDGRIQDAVAAFGRKKFGAKFPDTVTEAGIVGLLVKEPVDLKLLESIRFKVVAVSIGMHHSKGILVDGHQECAGNPVAEEKHKDDIRKSMAVIQRIVGGGLPVIGVFVKRSAEDPNTWEVEEVAKTIVV